MKRNYFLDEQGKPGSSSGSIACEECRLSQDCKHKDKDENIITSTDYCTVSRHIEKTMELASGRETGFYYGTLSNDLALSARHDAVLELRKSANGNAEKNFYFRTIAFRGGLEGLGEARCAMVREVIPYILGFYKNS